MNKYAFHKHRAKERGIAFQLTYDQWFDIWLSSGHLHERGNRKGQYVMARFGDKGPYAVGNVKIITNQENTYEQTEEARNRIALSVIKRAQLIDYLGNAMTISQAVYAAGNVVTYTTAFRRLKLGWPHREAVEMPVGSKRSQWPSLQLG